LSERSRRFALPFLQAGQAHKELIHNEALAMLDHLTHLVVEAEPANLPPAAPEEGTSWLVGSAPAGEWAGNVGAIALWTEGGWRFAPSHEGMIAWLRPNGALRVRRNGGWEAAAWPVAAVEIGGQQVVGPRQPAIVDPGGGATADAEARAAIVEILLTLRTHGLISQL